MYESTQQRDNARKLRHSMTDAERKLWYALRKRQLCGCRFRRQFGVGPYIVDFECFEQRLVVELDGGQHNTPAAREYDTSRTAYLDSLGYRVLRFWNDDVMNDLDSVLEVIARSLESGEVRSPHPGPPPKGEGAGISPPPKVEGDNV